MINKSAGHRPPAPNSPPPAPNNRDALDDLRGGLSGLLDDLAVDLATTAVITIAAAFVTAGIASVAGGSKAAPTITRYAATIRDTVLGWAGIRRLDRGVRTERDLAKAQSTADRINSLERRAIDQHPPPSTPKPAPPTGFPPEAATRRIPTEWGPGRPNGKGNRPTLVRPGQPR